MQIKIAIAQVLDPNGTYLIKGSILPVYLDEEGEIYLIEEYEKGNPCEHYIKDLIADGVFVSMKTIQSRGWVNE